MTRPPATTPPWAIRPLTTIADYEACVALQRLTWGDDFRELVPPAMLQVTGKMGGITAGAFVGDRLVGFVYGMTGVRDGALAHWSHMLAVEPALRDRGLGRALKAYQRECLRAEEIHRMYWTFDPLVARNAHLNLRRLGARVAEYVCNMYGENPMSRTDSVIGSDRFVVVWELDDGTRDAPVGEPADGPTIATADDPLADAPTVFVAIPEDVQELKQRDPAAALAWRAATRRAFSHYLSRGYLVADFDRQTTTYRLERRR